MEEGDYLMGVLSDVTEAWSDVRGGGSFYPLLTVKVEEAPGYEAGEELKVHAFGAVLYNEVERHRPEVGERLKISYHGQSKREPKPGQNPPEVYRLKVYDRADQAQRSYGRIFGAGDKTGTLPQAPQPVGVQSELGEDTSDLPFS